MRKKQIDESMNLIMNGFFTILSKKEYSKISMSEIAEASMVTRMTLYRHFKNKDEILKFTVLDLVHSIKKRYDQLEDKTMSNLLIIRNEEISKNKYLNIAFSNKEAETIIREVITLGRKVFFESKELFTNENKYVSDFIIGGIETITSNWILGGMKESPEVITNETVQILNLLKHENKGKKDEYEK